MCHFSLDENRWIYSSLRFSQDTPTPALVAVCTNRTLVWKGFCPSWAIRLQAERSGKGKRLPPSAPFPLLFITNKMEQFQRECNGSQPTFWSHRAVVRSCPCSGALFCTASLPRAAQPEPPELALQQLETGRFGFVLVTAAALWTNVNAGKDEIQQRNTEGEYLHVQWLRYS